MKLLRRNRHPVTVSSVKSLEGCIDVIDEKRVIGWVYDADDPDKSLLIAVQVSDDSAPIIALANVDRPDLRNAGKGNGLHGFIVSIDTSKNVDGRIHIRVVETGVDIPGSPVSLHICAAAARSPNYVDLLRYESYKSQKNFVPLRGQKLEQDSTASEVLPYKTRCCPDKLFEPYTTDGAISNTISRYLVYEFQRFSQENDLPLSRNNSATLRLLHWYIAVNRRHRGYPLPLSRSEITFLNSPMPILGAPFEISIAAYYFIRSEFDFEVDFSEERSVQEAIYWWCTECAPSLEPSGGLITSQQASILARPDGDTRAIIPLNYFLRRLWSQDPLLSKLDIESPAARAVLVCAAILRCSEKPYYAQFLPRNSIRFLLSPSTKAGEDAQSQFERLISLASDASGQTEAPHIGGVRIQDYVKNLEISIGRHGYSLLRSVRRDTQKKHASPCFIDDPRISVPENGSVESGVAVIGPSLATSGLGQATRLSINVLKAARQTPVVLDFSLDNPSATGFSTPTSARELRVPKRINLFHLNAEMIPLALAQLDARIYKKSYNIGYFFWELDRIPSCQRLSFDLLDEIWVSSEFNRRIYSQATDLPVVNVGMAVEPTADPRPIQRADFGFDDDAFLFLVTFDSFSFIARKNPIGVIHAFQKAYPMSEGANVNLILKTQNRTRVGDSYQVNLWKAIDDATAFDTRIKLIDDTFDYPNLLGFKKMCDAYVSLHRSEGFGFGILEAMQLGLPVIATGYSGNMDFCNDNTSWLVDHNLVPVFPSEYLYVERGSHWAEPSIESAAAAMRAIREDPAKARRKSEAAQSFVREKFSLGVVAERYRARLFEIERIIEAQDR